MQTGENSARDVLRLIFWYPLRWLLLALPIRAALLLLRRMGDLHYTVSTGKKQILLENLRRSDIVADEKTFRKHIRTYFQTHYLDQLFPIISSKLTRQNIKEYVTIHGLANLERVLQRGRGAILIHGHFGPVHVPLMTLALMGYPMKQIGNPSDNHLSWIGRNVAFRLRVFYENQMPAEIVKATSFLRPVFTALQQNEAIMTTGDGSGNKETFGKHGMFTFLGQPVYLPLGPALLARKTDAALLPLFMVPDDHNHFTINIGEEILSSDTGDRNVIDCTNQFAVQLQQYIRACPGYWHFLDRFKPGQFIRTEADNAYQENPAGHRRQKTTETP